MKQAAARDAIVGRMAANCYARLLLLQHTGRIRMFRPDATELFAHYLAALLLRTADGGKDGPDAAGSR